mgnify:CR=1 FL=1
MLFNSIDFLLFFPAVVFIYFLIPVKFRYIWLAVSSYYFYMCWNPLYALILLGITGITYAGGIIIEGIRTNKQGGNKQKKIKAAAVVPVIIALGILGYFKYANFLLETFNIVFQKANLGTIPKFDVILPLGISLYTLTAIGYIADVYREKCGAEKNFLKYALFVSFFPQILSGPIERSGNLLKQIGENEKKGWDYQRVTNGLMTMLWGFFVKMVVADRIAVLANTAFEDYESYGMVGLGVGAVAYGIQIYCDFYSYSVIAVGTARVFGFELIHNFDTPYFAKSGGEFWRRWHISLSTWLRDYIYIPLGGNRCGKWKQYRNIILTFTASGLWHGANWTFVIWGMLHGIYQIAEKEIAPFIRKLNARCHTKTTSFGYKFAKTVLTFCMVDFAWIFFRAESVSHALHYIERMFVYRDWWSLFDQSIYQMGLDAREIQILALGMLILLAVELIQYFKRKEMAEFLTEQWGPFRWCALITMIVCCVVFGYYGQGFDSGQFIYLQF